MKLTLAKEWFTRRADLEADVDVAAGSLALTPTFEETAATGPELNETRLALGPLVQLMRRKRGLSMEKLAQEARVDLVEIVSIERDASFRPEPRTVYQIANVFDLPSKSLLQLSGNSVVKDAQFRQEAVRFAARSESVARLTRDEQRALEEYVSFLSRQT